MRTKNIILTVWVLILLGAYGYGWYWIKGVSTSKATDAYYAYNGKQTLTEEQYSQLKQTLVRDDIIIHDLKVYSSNEPLIIYSITSRQLIPQLDKYTYHPETTYGEASLWFYGICMGILLVGIICFSFGGG